MFKRPLIANEHIRIFTDNDGFSAYDFPDDIEYAKQCFLGNDASWPTAQQLGVDSSQYDALKLALSNKLALIQG